MLSKQLSLLVKVQVCYLQYIFSYSEVLLFSYSEYFLAGKTLKGQSQKVQQAVLEVFMFPLI